MKKLVILLGKLMSQRSAFIATLAAKGSPSDAELRKLSELHNAVSAVREVLASKQGRAAPPAPTSQTVANSQQSTKRMIAR